MILKIIGDYHTHTQHSHGSGSIEDNVIAARRKQIYQLGITDHGPASLFIGIKDKYELKKMKEELYRLNEKYPDMRLYLGIEANLISEDGTLDLSQADMHYLDFVVMGFHLNVIPKNISAAYRILMRNWLRKLFNTDNYLSKNRIRNTDMLLRAMDKYSISFISHPGIHLNIDTVKLSAGCADRNVKLEINCNKISEMRDFVSTAVQHCSQVKFVISSDAHTPEQVGELDTGIKLCRQLKLTENRVVNVEWGKR